MMEEEVANCWAGQWLDIPFFDIMIIEDGRRYGNASEINIGLYDEPRKREIELGIEERYFTHPEVTWTSSNPAVASVSDSGVITPHAVGTTIIKVQSQYYQNVYCEVTYHVVATEGAGNPETISSVDDIGVKADEVSVSQIDFSEVDSGIDSSVFTDAIAAGKGTDVVINAEAKAAPSTPEIKQQFEELALKNDYNEIQYIDISMLLRVVDAGEMNVRKTKTPIAITVKIPQNMSDCNSFGVLRSHDGVTEEIATNYNEATNEISFETSLFSDYAIVGKKSGKKSSGSSEQKVEETPEIHRILTEKYAQIDSAVPGKTTVLEMGTICNLPQEFIKKIAAKNNCSFIIRFTYNKVNYEISIPAGKKIDTSFLWYGPKKLMQMFGFKVIK